MAVYGTYLLMHPGEGYRVEVKVSVTGGGCSAPLAPDETQREINSDEITDKYVLLVFHLTF